MHSGDCSSEDIKSQSRPSRSVGLAWWHEGLIYLGVIMVIIATTVVIYDENGDGLSKTVDQIVLVTYLSGCYISTCAAGTGLLRLRNHQDIFWLSILFIGVQATLWSPLAEAVVVSRARIIFEVMVISGFGLVALSIARLRLFRHSRFRLLFKVMMILGMALYDLVALVNLRGNAIIIHGVGVSLLAIGYIVGRLVSRKHSDGTEAEVESLLPHSFA